jgi:hypothetical protein
MSGERAGIYIASRVKHAPRWQRLRESGTHIISSWIDEAGEGETDDFGELWTRIQREVGSAERLVFYAQADDFPFKGALVEVGIALQAAVPVFLVLNEDVKLDGRTLRPLGSWARHPLVTWAPTMAEAIGADLSDALETRHGG